MNWEAIGAVGEILGALAVVATLGYLAVQTRHSVAATQANTRQAMLAADQVVLMYTLQNPEIDDIRWGTNLSDHDKTQLGYFFIMFLRIRENNWFQFQHGGLDEETWNSYRVAIPAVLGNPNGISWWENYGKPAQIYNGEFSRLVDELLAKAPVQERSPLFSAFKSANEMSD